MKGQQVKWKHPSSEEIKQLSRLEEVREFCQELGPQ